MSTVAPMIGVIVRADRGSPPPWAALAPCTAADALAATVPAHVRSAEYILPSMFDKDVVPTIAKAVAAATRSAGLSRRAALPES